MGLAITHNTYNGAYSTFSKLRNAIATVAGYGVCQSPVDRSPNVDLDYRSYPAERFAGVWPETPSDILLVLFVHSDCDGEIVAEHCGPLADRLEQLQPEIASRDDWFGQLTAQFVEGLRSAAAAGEPVEFH